MQPAAAAATTSGSPAADGPGDRGGAGNGAVSSEWVATLDGYVNAQIRPQVSGYLIRRSYGEGAMVSKGQVLFEIDPRPFQATLAQAKAQLAQAQAELGRTERDVQRDTPLAKARAIPRVSSTTTSRPTSPRRPA